MKSILIPTDFSENARNAMQYAAQLYNDVAVQFYLTHAYYVVPPSIDPIYDGHVAPEKELAEQLLQEELYRFEALSHHPDTVIETTCQFGAPEHLIPRIADEKNASVIVMGTKGASGIQEVLMGSVAVGVIKHAECPVICVPDNAKFTTPKRIVFAADYNEIPNVNSLAPMKTLVERFNSKLLILKVRREKDALVTAEQAEEGLALHGYLQEVQHDFYDKSTDKIENGIQDFAHEMNADMMVMLKRKHSFWERLFNKSITNKVAFHTDLPLMVLHEISD